MRIVTILNPFQRFKRDIKEVSCEGLTIEKIAKEFFLAIEKKHDLKIPYEDAEERIVISVNGLIIPQSYWETFKLRDDHWVVIVPIVGKGESEKQISMIVAMVALAVAAPYLAGSLLGAEASAFALAVTQVAIVAGGGLLIQSQMPKPKTPSDGFHEEEVSQFYGWEPTTQQRVGIPVPIFFGKMKLRANTVVASRSRQIRAGYPNDTTDGEDNNMVLEALFGLAMGPIVGVLEPPSAVHITTGTIGFNSNGSVNSRWRSLTVVDLPGENDLYTAASWATDIGTPPAIGNWTAVDIGTDHAPGNWDSEAGTPDFVQQESNITGPTGYWSSPLQGIGGTILTYDNGDAWTNYKATFQMSNVDDDTFGFMFRYVDADNHYRFIWNQENESWRKLVKRKNGIDEQLWGDETAFTQSQWYSFVVECEDATIRISIDGTEIINMTDSDPQIKINGQRMSNFRAVSYETRNGYVTQDAIDYFTETPSEYIVNRRVINGTPIVFETVNADFDKLSFVLSFPNGLYDASGGSIDNLTVQAKIEVKNINEPDSAYIEVTQTTENISDQTSSLVTREYSTIRRTVTGISKANPGVVTCDTLKNIKNGDSVTLTDTVGMVEVNDRTYTVAEIDYDNNTFEIEDTSGFTTYTSGGIVHVDIPVTFGERYNIRVTKVSAEQNSSGKGDDLYFDSVKEITQNEFTYPRTALVGIRALATDQLSGRIDFSCIAKGSYVRVYDDAEEEWNVEYSNNPAWVIYHLFTKPVISGTGAAGDAFTVERYDGLANANIDLEKFTEFADFCSPTVANEIQSNILAISKAAEAIIETSKPHNLYSGDGVVLRNIHGMTEITTGTEAVVQDVIDEYTFSVNINSSAYTAFVVPTHLLLHLNGADQAQSSIDESIYSHEVRFWKSAQLDTASKKWGTASLMLDGTDDFVQITNEAALDIVSSAADDWTVDLQVAHDDHAGTEIYLAQYEDASNYWQFGHIHGEGLFFKVVSGGTTVIEIRYLAFIAGGTGTAIGTMTTGPGTVASAFDGDATGGMTGNTASAYRANVDKACVGKDWGVGNTKTIRKAVVKASTTGFCQSDTTYNMYLVGCPNAPDDPDPSGTTGRVVLASKLAQTDASQKIETFEEADITTTTAYRYHWVEIDGVQGNNGDKGIVELELYEKASGAVSNEITDTDWHHIALCKVADEYGIYLDGTQKLYVQDSSTDTFTGDHYIGQDGSGANFFDGHLDEISFRNTNAFSAAPNNTPDDTITEPVAEYTIETASTAEELKHFIEFNGGFDAETNVWDAVMRVCEVCRCVPFWNGTQITLSINKSASPVQMFNVGNIIKDSFSRRYLPQAERSNELEVHYLDEDQDYVRVPFSDDNTSIDTGAEKSRLDVFGITNRRMAGDLVDFKLLLNQYLTDIITFDVDIDALACTLGDRLYVQHDVPDWSEGGRIISATNNTIVVDKAVTATGGTDKVLVKIYNPSTEEEEIEEHTVASVSSKTITITDTWDVNPSANDLFCYGADGSVAEDYRIIDLKRKSDLVATLMMVNYNELCYAGDPS